MIPQPRERWRSEDGQSTVELALVLPIIAALVILVVQVAAVIEAGIVVHHAAREAVRATVVEPTVDATAMVTRSTDLNPDRLHVSRTTDDAGSLVTVVVEYRVPISVPLLGVVTEPIITGSASMTPETSSAVPE